AGYAGFNPRQPETALLFSYEIKKTVTKKGKDMKTMQAKIVLCGLLLSGSAAAVASEPLTLAWDAEPRTIDPRYATDANSQYLENLVHCSLIGFDQDGKTIELLAEEMSWTTPTTLKVKIASKAKFSDGTAVTPADVKATYDFFLATDVKEPSPRKGAFSNVSEIKTGKDEVTFVL